MRDPATAQQAWERAQVALVNNWKPGDGDPVRLVLDTAKRIERARAKLEGPAL